MTTFTDVDITIHLKGIDNIGQAEDLHVTFRQGTTEVDVSGDRVSVLGPQDISLSLSQRETGRFVPDAAVKVQLNFFLVGKRRASRKKTIDVADNLLRRILGNG